MSSPACGVSPWAGGCPCGQAEWAQHHAPQRGEPPIRSEPQAALRALLWRPWPKVRVSVPQTCGRAWAHPSCLCLPPFQSTPVSLPGNGGLGPSGGPMGRYRCPTAPTPRSPAATGMYVPSAVGPGRRPFPERLPGPALRSLVRPNLQLGSARSAAGCGPGLSVCVQPRPVGSSGCRQEGTSRGAESRPEGTAHTAHGRCPRRAGAGGAPRTGWSQLCPRRAAGLGGHSGLSFSSPCRPDGAASAEPAAAAFPGRWARGGLSGAGQGHVSPRNPHVS